ncbi:MAG: MerR HTH family regulatory protein [Rhodobacteraceae bacterium HLUCCA12]|nr:MAG: MerR HTH family regulatory protein [Rhodobacteraceae bacterium HLUCCA12]
MSLTEQMVLARVRRLTRRDLRHWVQAGWVRPAMGQTGPVFDEIDVARLRLLCDLRKDMALPPDALPVVLTLIDRLHETRRGLRLLMEALGDQPEDIRRAVIARMQARGTSDPP